jgi:hypothetical protein
VPYDAQTPLLGVVARHADDCPDKHGGACTCGPLGYCGGVWDWQAGSWVSSPLVQTAVEARGWQRAFNAREENDGGASLASSGADGEAHRFEQLVWWAFCYVGLGFFGVALALFTAHLGG